MKEILLTCSRDIDEQKRLFYTSLVDNLEKRGFNVVYNYNLGDTIPIISHNARIVCLIYDWEDYSLEDIRNLSVVNPDLPVYAISNRHKVLDLNLRDFMLNIDFLQYESHLLYEDAERIEQAIDVYLDKITPAFTKGLMKYVKDNKYTFCTPGHLGGTAFNKSPVGTIFYDFFGSNVFKADISISVPELGSLLDHTALHKEAEDFIAETFNADRSLMVVNGTSTANKIIGMYAAGDGDTILVDRNCHKSICHFMMMTNVVPLYLKPTRNAYGILGGIPKREFTQKAINEKIAQSPIPASQPVYSVVTNSTYDGLFYDTEYIKDQLNVKTMHFDSAWVAYTNFHPIYKGHFGMYSGSREGKLIVETQSTHKLLAAFSQASMIHLKGEHDEEVMNECFMMHTTTSPLYQLVASCEISAAMMKGPRGYNLINNAVKRAMAFRHEIKKLRSEADTWYYDVWQPDNISGAECWALNPQESWHGFKDLDYNNMFLDPLKITVLLPGITNNQMDEWGIPASVVAMYLDYHGIIVEKTGPYSMLFLYSIGINKSKSMKLLSTLNSFKVAYDQNCLIKDVLPELYKEHKEAYEGKRIQELCAHIHNVMKHHNLPYMMYNAFDVLPHMEMTPHQAYQKLIKGKTKVVKLRELLNQTSAVMVLPYPPGVPLIMPGEKVTEPSKAVLDYLLMLEEIGKATPGFETDIHGVEKDESGDLTVKVIAE